ncbi:class I SAM-dependent methyltransferase [Myxococcota bacterium]|nr:class I SAM-dependent methyltransferase [Myxococcota bacterium]
MVKGDFSGERLQTGDPLFAVDLARHQAAYEFARSRENHGWLLDLGSGSGYGAEILASEGGTVVGLDRVPPETSHGESQALYTLGDVLNAPFLPAHFSRVVSFQVVEHFEDPTAYVASLSTLLSSDGEALVSTPNRLTSDGVNPYHLREYSAEELRDVLRVGFESVEVLGVSAGPSVQGYFEARHRRIERIMKLDFLKLRDLLPRWLITSAFAQLAVWTRRLARSSEKLPDASWTDFPIGPASLDCLDLLAVCRQPRRVI